MGLDDAPTIVLIDDDDLARTGLAEQLRARYGASYRVEDHGDCQEALDRLRWLQENGEPVALVLADLWLGEMDGTAVLAQARALHPEARRVLLVEWGDGSAQEPMLEAMSLGYIDYYLVKPVFSPDESFHLVLTEYLAAWSRERTPKRPVVQVVADPRDPHSHEMRDLLNRYSIPYVFDDADSPAGSDLLEAEGLDDSALPVVRIRDRSTLVQPTNAEIADALTGAPNLDGRAFDVAVVGAGPSGLASGVYAGSEGLDTVVVEREAVGGQAGTSSMIRNYLGFPRGIPGGELAQRAYEQALRFGTTFNLLRDVTALDPGGERHVLHLSDGSEVSARTVIVATGVSYRRLPIADIERFVGMGVFYGAATTEAPAMTGRPAYVIGGGNSAGQAAVHLARYASSVTLLVRGDTLAASMSDYLVKELEAAGNVSIRFRTEAVGAHGDGNLHAIDLRDRETGEIRTVPAGGLFVLIGASPRTDWLPDEVVRDPYGFVVTGNDLVEMDDVVWRLGRRPLPLETSLPGVFSVGDVRFRSVKRVASAVGEGSICISYVHEYVAGER